MESARTSARGAWVLVVAVAGFGLVLPSAGAYHIGSARSLGDIVSETVTLPRNNWTGYTFAIGDGDRLTYNLTVTSGTGIDLYIVPAAGLVNYASDIAPTFTFFKKVENWTTTTGVYTGARGTTGTTTVILDNVDFSGAKPSGSVSVSVNLVREPPPGPSLFVIALIVIGAVAAVAFIALLVLKRRRKPAAGIPPTGPPLYVGPPGPYAPPPYPPAPQPPPRGPYPPPPPS